MSAFPISALVGTDDLCLALILCAIDPGIGGVLLRGDKGSGKTTAARGLAALLADGAPFVELPLGATEDRVVGSLDLQAAFGGGYRFRPGLLSAADGGVLYVDEVNLLADHLVDLLLDAAATGEIRVERDGVSEAHRSRFVLVGSMNPEEGELRPQLLDRFGLSVSSTTSTDPVLRAEAVRRRLAFDADPVMFEERWRHQENSLRRRLAGAKPVPLEKGLEEQVGEICVAAGAEGLRADLVICRSAAALAGWEGSDLARLKDVNRVAPLALAHRRRTPWDDPGSGGSVDHLAKPSQSSSRGGPARDSDTTESEGHQSPTEASVDNQSAPGSSSPSRLWGDDAKESRVGGLTADTPGRLMSPARSGGRQAGHAASGRLGRLVGVTPLRTESDLGPIAPVATVLAALERNASAGVVEGLALASEDLRIERRVRSGARLVVAVVDASGSMGAPERIELGRQAILQLLIDTYQKRDRVALVAFRDTHSNVVLRPTGSVEVARNRMASLEVGGRTPLAAGIEGGLALALEGRHSGYEPVLVLISDGRATWADGGEDPRLASLRVAKKVGRAGVPGLIVHCSAQGADLGLVVPLATAMGATVVQAGQLSGLVDGPEARY